MKEKGFVLFLLLAIAVFAYFGKFSTTPQPVSKEINADNVVAKINERKNFRNHFFAFAENRTTIVFDQNYNIPGEIEWLRGYLRDYLTPSEYSAYTLKIRYWDGSVEEFLIDE